MAQQQEQLGGDIEVDDEVFFNHKDGPQCARVTAVGRHGITVDHEGKPTRVRHEHVIGHKTRAQKRYEILHEGEDGYIVKGEGGKRKYLAVPPEARLGDMILEKSLTGARLLVLAKSEDAPSAGKPGLTRKLITDRNGVQSNRWVKTAPDAPVGNKGSPRHVGFHHGEFKGHGRVMSSGGDGHTVQDRTGATHHIPHGAITHHWEGEGEPEASPHTADVHDINEKSKNAEEISRALFNDSDIAKLPDKAFQPVDSWEQLSEKAPEALKEFKGMLDKVAGSLGLVTGKRPQSYENAIAEEKKSATKEGRAPKEIKEDQYMLPEHWDNNKGFLFMGPLKGEARAKEKVEADYHGDWSQIRDMVRATIAVPMVTQIPKVLDELKSAGIELAQKPKNNLVKPLPGGYRDLNLIVKLPNGLLAELQVHIKPMTLAKEKGHKPYEVSRSIEAKYKGNELHKDPDKWEPEDREKHAQAVKEQEKLYGDAWKRASGDTPETDENSSNLTKAMKAPILFVYRKGVNRG